MIVLLLGLSIVLNIYQFYLGNKIKKEYQTLIEESSEKEEIINMKNNQISELKDKMENIKKQLSIAKMETENSVPDRDRDYMKKILPFKQEDIVDVAFYRGKEKTPLNINVKNSMQMTFQSLYWLQDNAKTDIDFTELLDLEPIYIVFKLKDKIIKYAYFYEENIIVINGEAFYPGVYLYLTFNQILEPNSIIAKISKSLVYEDIKRVNDSIYHFSRLEVNGKDYVQWEKELTKLTKVKAIPYYGMNEQIDFIEVYKEGIVKFDLKIVFTNDTYKTKDGITIGLTKDEVENKLGKPNSIAGNIWSYRRGDYLRFHIIFEGDKVKYLMETIPL